MTVLLEPKEVFAFERPLRDGLKKSIVISNPSATYVAFKFKTTAPRNYCVRPNAGFLSPQQSLEVTVMFQPRSDIDATSKCKDKFLVQTVVCPGGEVDVKREITEFWADAEKLTRETFQEQRLRCEYIDESSPQQPAAESAAADSSSNMNPRSSISGASSKAPSVRKVTAPAPVESPDSLQFSNAANNNLGMSNNSIAPSGEWMRERETLLRELATLKSELIVQKAQANSSNAKSTNAAASSTDFNGAPTDYKSLISALEGAGGANERDSVLSRTIATPNTYSIKFVFIVGLVSFVLGLLLY